MRSSPSARRAGPVRQRCRVPSVRDPWATTATIPTPRLKVTSISARRSRQSRDQVEDRLRRPGRPVDHGGEAGRQHPSEVGREAAAGDVRERMHVGTGGQSQAVARVDPGGRQQLVGEGTAAELRRRSDQRTARCSSRTWRTSENPLACRPDEPSAMSASPAQTRCGAEHRVGVHHADPGAGDVVLVRAHHARVLGGLAADQRAAGLHASLRDAGRRSSRSSPARTWPVAM